MERTGHIGLVTQPKQFADIVIVRRAFDQNDATVT